MIHLSQLLEEKKLKTFLLDASGVIYTDYGVINGVTQCIQVLNQIGSVFLVINNSYSYPTFIQKRLFKSA